MYTTSSANEKNCHNDDHKASFSTNFDILARDPSSIGIDSYSRLIKKKIPLNEREQDNQSDIVRVEPCVPM